MNIPRMGNEVLIEFVDGDPRRPVIVGSLYNGSNVPPYELPANKTQTVLKTWSTPGGGGYNELRFEDKAGAEEIYLKAENDLNIEVGGVMTNKVDSDATLTVEGDLTQTVKGDRTLVSEGLYSQTVGGDRISTSGENDSDNVAGNRTVATQGNYTHAAAGRIHVSAVQELKLSVGGATLVLKPNGQVLVNGTNIA